MMPNIYENWSWPYEQALTWMSETRTKCLQNGDMSIGIGAHDAPLITLGRHATQDEIKDTDYLCRHNVKTYHINRGGGATFHGPGQIVLYPIANLQLLGVTIPDFTKALEHIITKTLEAFKIQSHLKCGEPGVFVEGAKIGAIGMHISGGIVTHGLSLNVCNDLEVYSRFRPCRKDDAQVTSMQALGIAAGIEEVSQVLLALTISQFSEIQAYQPNKS